MSKQHTTSRRDFLRHGTALVAGGAVAPFFFPSGALAAPKRVSANDRIGIGYIGTGRRSGQLRQLPKDGQIVAAADCNLSRAEKVAEKYHGKAYQDYRELLDSNDVDAVIIASPDHWHALHAVAACQAHKDVYVEKPMTLTIHEGRMMVKAARQYGQIVQVGSQQRSMEANRVGCQLVRDGAIGRLKKVYGTNYPSPWGCDLPGQPVPEQLNWDMWCGPTEVVPFHQDIYTPRANPGWISFRPWSGGEITGWGAHGLDQIQWALGMDESGPVEIWTEGEAYDPPVYTEPRSRQEGDKLCSHPIISYRYASGVVVELSKNVHGGGIFVGEKGTITIDRGVCKISPADLATPVIPESGILKGGSEDHMQNWFDSMRSRQLPAADVEIGHRSTTVCHLGNIARWTGRKLRWDPAKEVFLGDDQANALLDRARRKPYLLPEVGNDV